MSDPDPYPGILGAKCHTEPQVKNPWVLIGIRQSANEISGSPYTHFDAAKSWATWALKLNTSESDIMAAFSTAIRLASLVIGIDQTVESRHEKLIVYISDLSTIAAAAALSFGRPGIAVEWPPRLTVVVQ